MAWCGNHSRCACKVLAEPHAAENQQAGGFAELIAKLNTRSRNLF